MKHVRIAWWRLLVLLIGAVLLAPAPAGAVPFPTVYSVHCAASVTITTTTETAACTIAGLTTGPGQVVRVLYTTQVTSGAGTTALTLRVRQGTGVTGSVLGPANAVQTTAGNTVQLAYAIEANLGETAGLAFTVTVAQTAATANGTILDTEIVAHVF